MRKLPKKRHVHLLKRIKHYYPKAILRRVQRNKQFEYANPEAIHELVMKAKTLDNQAFEELLNIFAYHMDNYRRRIHYKENHICDITSRSMVSKFSHNEIPWFYKCMFSTRDRTKFMYRMSHLKKTFKTHVTDSILYYMYAEALWNLVRVYYEGNQPFAMVVSKLIYANMTFILLKFLYGHRILNKWNTYKVSDDDWKYYSPFNSLYKEQTYNVNNNIIKFEELGADWIAGNCDESLQKFSPFERYILKIIYTLKGCHACSLLGIRHTQMKHIKADLVYAYHSNAQELTKCKVCGNILYTRYAKRCGYSITCSCYFYKLTVPGLKDFEQPYNYRVLHENAYNPTKAARWFYNEREAYEF